ncbi:hypothetical protein D3C81_1945630 [compost metagenome]
MTGSPPAVFQFLRIQPGIHWVSPWRTYWESVNNTMLHGSVSASNPEMAAISSIRLLVVWASPPLSSRSCAL